MPTNPQQTKPSGLDLNEILFIIFRHKWKILFCSLAGFAAAAVLFLHASRMHESQAKLLVRYILERSAIDSQDSQQTPTGGRTNDTIIEAEMEIMTSWDLAVQVADTIGPDRLLKGSKGPVTTEAAAAAVASGLMVTASTGSNVILVSYQNRDPELAVQVLDSLLSCYFTKHLEVHRSAGAFQFVSQQADQVHYQLQSTEDELKRLKAEAGIVSLPEAMQAIADRISKTEEDLSTAEADLSEQSARVAEINKTTASALAPVPKASTDANVVSASPEETQQYQALVTRLASLRQSQLELDAKYTPTNELVRLNEAQIESVRKQAAGVEAKYPGIAAEVPRLSDGTGAANEIDPSSERAKLAGAAARIDSLKSQLADLQKTADKISEAAPQISDLEQRKDVEETSYKYFESSLEQARVDEALDPSKIPNISIIQKPSPAAPATGKIMKLVMGIAFAGVALGAGLALLIELVFDPSVKRSQEVEKLLHIPVLVSIPQHGKKVRRGLLAKGDVTNGVSAKALAKTDRNGSSPVALDRFIQPYSESIRDRLILSFELKRLTHKPKLVAVTGISGGEGTSTVASGLAASLSETGDGKVLLVEMNGNTAAVHHFSQGKSIGSLADALHPREDIAASSDNLFLASAGTENGGSSLGAKRFYGLIPNLRASAFDYIIFDMPPLTRSSATLAVSGFMDKVLLVIEADVSDRNALKRCFSELAAAGADASVVFNKKPAGLPKMLNGC